MGLSFQNLQINTAGDRDNKNITKIKITLRRQDKNAEIIVMDNGSGLKKAKLNKIFVKFYQVNTSTIREHAGIGSGLSVCKGDFSS